MLKTSTAADFAPDKVCTRVKLSCRLLRQAASSMLWAGFFVGAIWSAGAQPFNTQVDVVSSAASSTYGQSITFTATVTTQPGGLPVGSPDTVTFDVDGVPQAPVTLDAAGQATLTTSALAVGTPHVITVNFNGDGISFNPSSATLVPGFLVTPAFLTVTATDTSRTYGAADPVFTASINGFKNGEDAGVVSGAPDLSTSATATSPVGTYAISAALGTLSAANYLFSFVNGTLSINPATLTVTPLSASTSYNGVALDNTAYSTNQANYTFSGFVNGETNTTAGIALSGSLTFNSSTSTAVQDVNSYALALGTLTLNSTATNYVMNFTNPLFNTYTITPALLTITANNQTKTFGQTFTFLGTEFTTSALQNGESVGAVTLTSAGAAAGASVSNSPYTITPSAATGGTFNPANYAITYADGSFTVLQSPTTTAVDSSAHPSVFGQVVNFTATVSPIAPGAGTPTGTIQFQTNGVDFGGLITLTNGSATNAAISTLAVGDTIVAAIYSGDIDFSASTNSVGFTQTVNKADTSVSLSALPNPSTFGQSVTFTATVTANSPGSGIPTGNVTFKDGATTLGVVSLDPSGVANFPISTLAVGSHSITADYGGDISFNISGSNQVVQDVVAGALDHFAFDPITSPQTAGSSFSITITAQDTGNNTATSFNGTVALSTTVGTITPNVSATFVNGVWSGNVTLTTAGSQTITATHTVGTETGVSNPFNVTAAAGQLVIQTQPSASAVSGVAFAAQPVIRIEDLFGNLITSDNSTVVTVALASGTGALQGTLTATATNGIVTFNNLSHNIAETITLAFSAPTLTGVISASVVVTAGPLLKLQILVPGETAAPGTASGKTGAPGAQMAGAAFNVTVNAVDADWNVVNTVTDTVAINPSDVNAPLPANAALVAGTQTFSVTLNTAGSATVGASDVTQSSILPDTSPAITVGPGAAVKLQILLPGEIAAPGSTTGKTGTPTAQTAGASLLNSVVVNAVDALWNVVTSAVPDVLITSTDTAALIADDNGASAGQLTLVAGTTNSSSFTFLTAGTQNIIVTDANSVLAANTSAPVTVNAGAASQLVVTTQPSASTVAGVAFAQQPVVQIQDAFGNVVTTGADATRVVTVALTTGSGTLSGTLTKTAVAGVADFAGNNL
ncbi:MAG: Ig-like domain repeat protein, partial [Verrucomicrobia bacterium]|nr:Ig-like domain repeat protein [Verrucomicrobiota bacterium]